MVFSGILARRKLEIHIWRRSVYVGGNRAGRDIKAGLPMAD